MTTLDQAEQVICEATGMPEIEYELRSAYWAGWRKDSGWKRSYPLSGAGGSRFGQVKGRLRHEKEESPMTAESNKGLVRRQFDEVWNGENWATVDELFAPEYVNHDPYNPNQGTGPEGFKQRVSGYRSVLHNFDLRVERQLAEGDMVETHWSLRGVHGGPLEGVGPTGKSVYVDGQLLSRIIDGKFVEEWVHWDTLGLLRQIGAVPPPAD